MERQDYPAMLPALQPSQAVNLLNDRVKLVGRINNEIADWLQERRRIEEQYAVALRKLSRKQPPDDNSDLGIFSTPWTRIINATELLADSHQTLAQKINSDVETPLRDFASGSREMQGLSTIQGNLASLAKDCDAAQRKADKATGKGGKSAAMRVANASEDVDYAQSQWESQAPYVFENLQAVDERRLNHLRDVLTQLETHEVDSIERNRKAAEQCLNALLTVETADEIKTFALRHTEGRRTSERRSSRNPPSAAPLVASARNPSESLAPPPVTATSDDRVSQSGSIQEEKKSRIGGLRRLGTVIGRRRQSTQAMPKSSPAKNKSATNLGTTMSNTSDLPSPSLQNWRAPSPGFGADPISREPVTSSSQANGETITSLGPSTTAVETPGTTTLGSQIVNGGLQQPPPPQEQLDSVPSSQTTSAPNMEPTKDVEGFSVPSSTVDPISQAERDAALTDEGGAQPFKLDIRNAPISEEGNEAQSAMTNVANTLRAQAAQPKRSPTLRGRRDVRNTMFVPSAPELGTQPVANQPVVTTPPETTAAQTTAPQISALHSFQQGHRPFASEDRTMSDAQSVRSGKSLTSQGGLVKHPDMPEPGLNSSVVETVNAWFEHGQVTRAAVIGELALSYVQDGFSTSLSTENIRLENFHLLEKVAPNPAFINPLNEKPGEYTVDLTGISRTTVAFKYQVHLDEGLVSKQAPLLVIPSWKIEPTQTSAIVSYSLNPAFNTDGPVTFSNVVLILHLEGAKALSCQSKPAGTFSKEKNLIYWRMDEVTLSPGQPATKVLARFATDVEAKPGRVEARWDLTGTMGSGLGVSQSSVSNSSVAADPFADEGGSTGWKEVKSIRRLVSGTYVAT